MNKQSALLLGLVVAAAVTACAGPARDTSTDQAAVRTIGNIWYKAFNAGDTARVTSLYAPDAVVNAPGTPAVKGTAAIQELYRKMYETMHAAGLTAEEGASSEVGVSGDLAWQQDSYAVHDASGAIIDAGKSIVVLARRDGKWLMVRDIWNADAAPAAPAPTATHTD